MPRPLDGPVRSILAQRDEFIRAAVWTRRKTWVIVARRDSELTTRLLAAKAGIVEVTCDEHTRLQRLVERGA